MKAIDLIEEALRYKWSFYANRNATVVGRLYYFFVSMDLNDRVVMFMFGEDRQDARVRLEAALRVLGCRHLIEISSDEVFGRLQVPVCARDGSILQPMEPHLFGLVMSWRCGARDCHFTRWTFGFGARRSIPQTALDAGTALDINVRS